MDEERIGYGTQAAKENYQLYLNKYFDDFNISLNYQYSTYWQHDSQTQYGLYINAPLNFPLLSQNAANLSLSATRTERDNGNEEDAINLYLTVPLFRGHSITFSELYSRSAGNNQFNHQVGYSGYGEQDNYNINVGYNHGQHIDNQVSLSGFYSRDISQASTSINASYVPDQYHSIGGSINGGLTLTSKGAALHRSAHGDTRLMVETPDVSGIPLDNGVIKTNAFGLAVIPNVNSYRKSTASINTSQLPDDIESLDPSTDITLTKGAIGYRSLSVMKGHKLFVVFALSDGKHPPFGASVRNKNNQEVGLVGEGGVTWLVGVSPQEKLSLYWNNQPQCELSLPEKLNELTDLLLLPCSSAKAVRSVYSSSSK